MSTSLIDHRGHGVPVVLADMRDQVACLAGTLWAARGTVELMDTVAEIETLKSALDALELQVVGELDTTGAVQGSGWASTQDFLTTTTGGHKSTGPAVLRLATALAQPLMAPVGEALAQGWLSTAKAQVIVRAIDALPGAPDLRERAVRALLAEAMALDATELRKLSHRLLSIIDPQGEERRDEQALDREERAAHLGRHLTITEDQCGGAWIKGRCTTEDAALIKATLIPLTAPHPTAGPGCEPDTCRVPGCGHKGRDPRDPRDPRDHGTRMLDALVQGCRVLQTAQVSPRAHGATPRLALSMNLADLQKESGFATAESGEQLSASAVRRLCCDTEVIPAVLGTASAVLDVGRAHRLVTAAIWKALVVRDQHCRFPHCTRPPIMCHAHHLQHWADGGPTSLDNLILLCGHHHRLIHTGPWTIERTRPTGFDFHPPPSARRPSSPGPRDTGPSDTGPNRTESSRAAPDDY